MSISSLKILLVLDETNTSLVQSGVRRVVWALAKELGKMGHSVTLLANRGVSCPYAPVVEIDPLRELRLQIAPDFDIVHFHSRVDTLTQVPYVATHYSADLGGVDLEHTLFTSQSQAQSVGSNNFVYSGLDWDEYHRIDLGRRRDFFHIVADRSMQRNELRSAVSITRQAGGAKLRVLGLRRVELNRGFRVTLSPRVRFCANPKEQGRVELLLRSRGLLATSSSSQEDWLSVVESLFFGAPIFGSARGILPELVGEEFGLLSDDESHIVKAMKESQFCASHCHQYASDCFNSHIMAMQYLKKYEMMLSAKSLL